MFTDTTWNVRVIASFRDAHDLELVRTLTGCIHRCDYKFSLNILNR